MRRFCIRFVSCRAYLVVACYLLWLTGCNHSRQIMVSPPPKLPYKVEGAMDKTVIKMQAHFNSQGIQVITLGQDYLLSIPSFALFPSQSPQLTWASYGLLNDVACFLRQFRKVSVSVKAYVSPCGSPKREHALAQARARNVANYLWSQNINSRFIFTQGLGSDKPITDVVKSDMAKNSRIEITFRDTVA